MPHKKHLREEVKEDVKKVGREVKKNWKKIIVISSLVFIVLSTILLITGIRISFSIYDRLILNLNPADDSFTIKNNEEENITFFVSIKDSIFCSVECNYEFYDRSENKLLDSGSYTLRDKAFFSKSYDLMPYRKGSGQKIYNFDVTCKDIDTFLCATHKLIRKKSSFITLNYELTKEEDKIRDVLKPLLMSGFVNINNASKNLEKIRFILNKINVTDSRYLLEDYNLAYSSFKKILLEAKNISDLWSGEDYNLLNSLYGNDFFNESLELYSKSNKILNNGVEMANNLNGLIRIYNTLKDYFFEITYSNGKYYNNADYTGNVYSYLDNIKNAFDMNRYSLADFEKDLANVSYMMFDLNKTLGLNYENYTEEGQDIVLSEYSKKCSLGYCSNLTNDHCTELKSLFDEFSTKSYNITSNFSNQSYYTVINDSVKILASNESNEFYDKYCLNHTNFQYIANISDINIDYTTSSVNIIQNELMENLPMCCVYGRCSPCCTEELCLDDPSLYPVLLIHGHSLLRSSDPEPLLNMFSKIQYQLQEDNYVNAGTILFESNIYDYKEGDWGLSGLPVSAKASYYYDYFYSFGKYIYITRNVENLDTYAIRLNDIIKLLKYRTGKSKVNIIAHSMGGLVARRYIQIFGEDSVDKVILIATPNQGISGSVKSFCQVFGEKRECEDMYDDSLFMKKLDDPNYKVGQIRFYTISGIGCNTDGSDGDGIVTFDSSVLKDSKSYIVEGICDDTYGKGLHNDLVDIDKYPKTYDYINEILSEP